MLFSEPFQKLFTGLAENRHEYLRQQAANIVAESGCILDGLTDTSPDDNHSFTEHLKIIRTPCKVVGENMIIALAKLSKCCIKVYIAHSKPLIYQPLTSIVSDCSVNIAFHEPGHYRAILPIDNACNDGDMQLDNINTFIYRSFSSSASLRTSPGVLTSSSVSSVKQFSSSSLRAPPSVPTSSLRAPPSVPKSSSASSYAPPGVPTSASHDGDLMNSPVLYSETNNWETLHSIPSHVVKHDSFLKCTFFNSRSLRNKITDLYSLLDGQSRNGKFDLIFVCETWLDGKLTDGILLGNNNDYVLLRNDRPTRGGGVCAFIKGCIDFEPINVPFQYVQCEVLCVDIHIGCSFKHRFITVL